MSPRVFICAGEASGDAHAADLLAALRREDAGIEAFGVGGPRMEAEGFESVIDMAELGQAGLVEVLRHLPRLRELFATVVSEAIRRRPAVVVLVDFPDFNLRLARRLSEAGLPVVYYVSPQLWAWRRGRIRQIRRYVNRMLVLFPFEEDFYRRNGVDVRFVGHPLTETLADWRRRATPEPRSPHRILLMPGSRRGEVASLLPHFLEAGRQLLAACGDDLRLALVCSPVLPASAYEIPPDLAARLDLVQPGRQYEAMAEASAALVASGTATLELALLKVPMVVAYRLHPLSYLLARWLVKVPSIGLVNLVAGRRVVPECVQEDCHAVRLVESLLPMIGNGPVRNQVLAGLEDAAKALGSPGAGERAARAVLEVAGDGRRAA